MKWVYSECEPGDIIRVRIGSVYHCGIFVSPEEVIAFGLPPTAENLKNPETIRVIATDIDVFSCGCQVEAGKLSLREKLSRRSPEKTIALARSRIGEGGYNIIHNNCEHFVNDIVFDKKISEQEQAVREKWQAFNKSK